jgi:hypothetical protein
MTKKKTETWPERILAAVAAGKPTLTNLRYIACGQRDAPGKQTVLQGFAGQGKASCREYKTTNEESKCNCDLRKLQMRQR